MQLLWMECHERYIQFLEKYQNRRILFMELGVGDMTPSIIKLPFWRMTENLPIAFYVSVNLQKANPLEHLKGKALAVSADISQVMQDICNMIKQ